MEVREFWEKFLSLAPQEKIKFIYSHIEDLEEKERIDLLLTVIKDEKTSPIVRATALKFLRNTYFDDPGIFQKSLKESHQAVLKASRRALKDFEERTKRNNYIAKSVLRKIESTREKQKRFKILKAIVKLKASWVPKVLLEALSDPSESIREFIINELSQRESLNLNLVYQRMLKSPWYVKSAILKILGIRKESGAIKHIAFLLDDPNVDVRRSTTHALGEIGGKEALALLVRLTKDKNPYVRLSAEEALRKASNLKFS